ncbi:hypothetical protein BJ912DRAFT_1103429 [Pholiota molesta]|nr:hypothetical protein BJ912DRAFT_1103429 [Pholiota molesta]
MSGFRQSASSGVIDVSTQLTTDAYWGSGVISRTSRSRECSCQHPGFGRPAERVMVGSNRPDVEIQITELGSLFVSNIGPLHGLRASRIPLACRYKSNRQPERRPIFVAHSRLPDSLKIPHYILNNRSRFPQYGGRKEGVYIRGKRQAYNRITTIRSLKCLQGGWRIQFGYALDPQPEAVMTNEDFNSILEKLGRVYRTENCCAVEFTTRKVAQGHPPNPGSSAILSNLHNVVIYGRTLLVQNILQAQDEIVVEIIR